MIEYPRSQSDLLARELTVGCAHPEAVGFALEAGRSVHCRI
jgi:hypothetical protein